MFALSLNRPVCLPCHFAAFPNPQPHAPDGAGTTDLIPRTGKALRVLVLEDHPLIAAQLALDLREEGHQVLGPLSRLADVDLDRIELDGAILDVCLGRDVSYPLAERLRDRGVAVVFYTGSSPRNCPESLSDVPWLAKPAPSAQLSAALISETSRLRDARECLAMVQELRVFAARESGADEASSDAYVACALRQALALLQHDPLPDIKEWLMADIAHQIRHAKEWATAFKEQMPPSRLI